MCGVTPRLPFTILLTRWYPHTNAVSEFPLCQPHRAEELCEQRFAGVRRRAMRWNSNHGYQPRSGVIIDDFDLIRARYCPHEVHAILVVDANAMLSHPIP